MVLVILLMSQFAMAEDWFCKEESGQRDGNIILACGVGESMGDEGYARKRALENAIDEFKTICQFSSDCHGKTYQIEPKRTECINQKNGIFKCYRLIQINIE